MLRIIFPSAVLAILITLIIISLGYRYTARLFPLLVMSPVVALLVVQIFMEFRTKAKQEMVCKEDKPAGEVTLGKYLRSQAWVAALLLLIYLLGFVVGPSLFVLIYLRVHGMKWLTTMICAVTVIVIVYGAFGSLFEVYLYKGLLFSYMEG